MNKSTSTVAALYQQLLKHSNRVFLQRVCPDGEGMWSSEADPAVVQSIRRKGQFSEEFVLETLRAIDHLGQNPHFSIVLLDLGGKRTAENAEILQRSDFLILLSSNLQEISHWQQFAHCENCETIAFLESRLHKIDAVLNQTVCSHINFTPTLAKGILWNLDRHGNTATYESAVAQLATWLHDRFIAY
ncbi:hypothetical protein ACKFKG_25585 [Phormidesmis sp. 146-35]